MVRASRLLRCQHARGDGRRAPRPTFETQGAFRRPKVATALLTEVCFALVVPHAFAGVEGDVGLLQLVASEHRSNRERLLTWVAKIEVSTTKDNGDHAAQRWRSTVDYVYSAADDAVRWEWIFVEAPGLPVGYNPGQDPRGSAGVRSRALGATYHLEYDGRPKAASRFVPLVESGPRTSRRGINQTEFDPSSFFRNGPEDIESRLSFVADQKSNDGYNGTWVRREGSIVVLSVGPPDGFYNRYEFDLEKGGNLVHYLATDDNDSTSERSESTYEYALVDGVWMPNAIVKSHTAAKSSRSDRTEIRWVHSVVNDPVLPTEFTPERLGVRDEDLIVNTRAGANYRFGAVAERRVPGAWSVWLIAGASVAGAALLVAGVLVRRLRRLG